jgi:ATP phosphoribosyltransferase
MGVRRWDSWTGRHQTDTAARHETGRGFFVSTEDDHVQRIAIPNKGRLSQAALDLFERAGLKAEFRADRALVARLGDAFQAIFVRAQDIPEFVADGAAEFGITGADLIEESNRPEVTELLDLGFGKCRLIVAVRDDSPVDTPEALPEGTRVATSFPGLARRYFESLGVPIRIVPVSGAAEIAPHIGVADVIVDLSSTGSTLRVNGLREVGTILHSSARLIGNADADGSELTPSLESVLRAEKKRYLMTNVPRDRLEEVREVLPGISGPTIVDILDQGRWVAAHAVVDEDKVHRTIARLKALGAEGILVTRIERLLP